MKKPDAMWWSAPFSDDLLHWLQVTKVLQDALVGERLSSFPEPFHR